MDNLFATVVAGVLVFVLGQLVVKFIIEPFQKYWEVVGAIAGSIVYFANVGSGSEEAYFPKLDALTNDETASAGLTKRRLEDFITDEWKRMDDARRTLRMQAGQLLSAANVIPWYGFWRFLGFLPKKDDLVSASANLIGLSNSVYEPKGTVNQRRDIVRQLKLKISSYN